MKIGIFGGSFNPPHLMHFQIGVKLLDKGYVDKIIYVPTGSKYKYKNNLVSDEHRFKMLELMISHDDRFMVSDYELKSQVVYACETLDYFEKKYPNDEIYFVCGADNLSYVDEWKNGWDLLKNYKFLVVERYTDDIDKILDRYKQYKDNIIVTSINPDALSSTEIREKIKNNESVEGLLDGKVINYIKENSLY